MYRLFVTSGEDRPEGGKQRFRRDQIALVAGAHGFHDVFSGFLVPLLPLLIKRHRLSLTLAGSLTLLQRFPSLANPLLGALVDRLRLKPFLVLAPAVTAASMSLIGAAPSYPLLAGLLLLVGISAATLHVPGPVFVARYAGSQVGRGMSWFMVGGEGARTLAPIVALAGASAWGVDGLWRLAPLALGMGLLMQWRLVEPQRPDPRRRSVGSLGETWRRLRRPFAGVVGIIVARSFAVAAMTTFLPSYLIGRGASLWFAGISLSLLEAGGVVGTLGAGGASDRFGRRRVLAAMLLALPPLMLAFTVLDGWWLFPLLFGIGVTTFATNPVMMALVQDHAGDHPALANGLYMALNLALRAMVVVGVGAMGDAFGLERTYLYCAFAALVGVPFIWLVPR